MSWFLLYLDKDLKYKYFIDLDGFIKPEDLSKYSRFDSLINSLNFTGVGDNAVITRQLKDAQGKDMTVAVTSLGFKKLDRDDFIEWLKIGFVTPEAKMEEYIKNQVTINNKNFLIFYVIFVIIIVLVVIAFYYVIQKFSFVLSSQLGKIINIAQKIENKQDYKNEKHTVWHSYDISNLYSSLVDVDELLSSAFEFEKSKSNSDAVMRSSVAMKIFEMLGNFRILGVIFNNMGNVYMNQEEFDNAILFYERAIENAKDLYDGKIADQSFNLEEFHEKRGSRNMNLIWAYRARANNSTAKEAKKRDIEIIKLLCNSVLNWDRDRNTHHGRQIMCLCLKSWVARQQSDMVQCDEAMSRISTILKTSKDIETHFPIFLVESEVRYEKAMIDRAKGKLGKSLNNLTLGLMKDKKFELGQRRKYIRAIIDSMTYNQLELTPGILSLKQRYLAKVSNYQFMMALDYSASMRQRGKIENSVKAFLNMWDNHIKPEDQVSFVRFYLNTEVVFDFEAKYVNEFTKRHALETSHSPKDRTSIFDTVGQLVEMFSRSKKLNIKKIMVMITDGDDSSSMKTLVKVAKKVVKSGVTIICVGLNTNDKQTKILERLARTSTNGVFIQASDNLDALLQVLTDFSRNESYSMIKYEYSI